MSDPKRIENVIDIANKLPKGAAMIYRHFGAEDKYETATALRQIKGLQLLIGNDPELADKVKADGVHMPRIAKPDAIAKIRADHPNWIITQAATKTKPIEPNLNLDALLVSAIFPSRSPSAREPIGPARLSEITRQNQTLIYALGGITAQNTSELLGSGVVGIAAIGGIVKEIVLAEITVEPTPYGHRFVYRKPGHEDAELTMARAGDNLFNANHTGVPKSMGGAGIGKALIKVMSDHARETGYKVIPSCPFVAAMFKRNPDWAEGVKA